MFSRVLTKLNKATTALELLAVLLCIPPDASLSQPTIDRLMQLLSHEDPLVRFISARVLSRIPSARSAPQVLEALLDAIDRTAFYRDAFNSNFAVLRFRGGAVTLEACMGLCLVAKDNPEPVIPHLAQAIDQISGYAAVNISHALLLLTFPLRNDPISHWSDLTERQKEIIHVLLGSKLAWRLNGNMEESLAMFGLPVTRDALRAFAEAS